MKRRGFLISLPMAIPAMAIARSTDAQAVVSWGVVGVGETGARVVKLLAPELDARGVGSFAVGREQSIFDGLPSNKRILVGDGKPLPRSVYGSDNRLLRRQAFAAKGRFRETLAAYDRVAIVADLGDRETTVMLPELVGAAASLPTKLIGRFALPAFWQGGSRERMRARWRWREIRVGLAESAWVECPECADGTEYLEIKAEWERALAGSVRRLLSSADEKIGPPSKDLTLAGLPDFLRKYPD